MNIFPASYEGVCCRCINPGIPSKLSDSVKDSSACCVTLGGHHTKFMELTPLAILFFAVGYVFSPTGLFKMFFFVSSHISEDKTAPSTGLNKDCICMFCHLIHILKQWVGPL